jgi:hypothetical protein
VSATFQARANDIQYLAELGRDPAYVAQLLALIQQTPSMTKEGMSCLEMLETATTSLMGLAPAHVSTALLCLKFAKKLPAFVAKTKALLSDLKSGAWTSDDGNNILHIAVQSRARKLAAYCIANCHSSIFSQENAQGFAPRQFATYHKNLLKSQRDQHLLELSELERNIAQRNEQRKAKGKKENVRPHDSIHLSALNNKIEKAQKSVSHIDAILAMLDAAEPFFALNAKNIDEVPVIDVASATTLEILNAALAKLKMDLYNFGTSDVPLQSEERQEFTEMFDILLEFGCLTPRLYALVRPAEDTSALPLQQ